MRHEERVCEPTRGEYLLVLLFSNMGPLVTAKAIPSIADRTDVLGKLSFPLLEIAVREREVFQCSNAIVLVCGR